MPWLDHVTHNDHRDMFHRVSSYVEYCTTTISMNKVR